MSYNVLIPAYKPDERLVRLVEDLLLHDIENILVIDDGSKNKSIFQKIVDKKRVRVITHPFNLGKGRALKTGLNFYLHNKSSQSVGIVTADADGQHLVKDIINIGRLLNRKQALIIGTRDFYQKEVPLRSRGGNLLTRNLFGFLTNIWIKDTQTGLRGIPASFVKFFYELPGDRFEYELNMLMCCKEHQLPLYEQPIETVYLNENKSSHFNPFTDSLKIYSTLLGINKAVSYRDFAQRLLLKSK